MAGLLTRLLLGSLYDLVNNLMLDWLIGWLTKRLADCATDYMVVWLSVWVSAWFLYSSVGETFLILSLHLQLRLPSDPFSWGFRDKILYAFIIFPSALPSHLYYYIAYYYNVIVTNLSLLFYNSFFMLLLLLSIETRSLPLTLPILYMLW
jgi:hypothetical protein